MLPFPKSAGLPDPSILLMSSDEGEELPPRTACKHINTVTASKIHFENSASRYWSMVPVRTSRYAEITRILHVCPYLTATLLTGCSLGLLQQVHPAWRLGT